MPKRSAPVGDTRLLTGLNTPYGVVLIWLCVFGSGFGSHVRAQSNIATLRGTVTDPSGAVVQGCAVRISNAINGYLQVATTDSRGGYQLVDVPFNRYLLEVEAPSFERASRQVTVNASLVHQIDVQLGVAQVRQEVTVSSANELIEPEKTAPATVIDRNSILRFPSAEPSRSVEEVIATAPGWTLDAGGRLHARGLEYQVQYSIDGIPVTDTIASAFGASPDPRSFRSMEVSTASIPAEYGNKLGGLIEVTSRSGRELANQGSATLSGGSFSTVEGAFDYGGHTPKFGYFVSAAGTTTDRFLDPPALENFHNHGRGVKTFFKFDYAPNQKDLFRLNLFANAQRFDVPNLPDQESAGQDQWRRSHDNMQSLSWEHVFSTNAVSYLAGYHRYNAAKLRSNTNATPVFAEQTRHHSYYGMLGSLTYQKGRHTIKGGLELSRFPLSESFTFAITDLDALLADEPDLPEEVQELTLSNAFFFRERKAGWEGSAYVQDHFKPLDRLTLDAGVRFDSYHFLVDINYVSPRLGAAYHIERTGTVLRAAYNRFMQTPVLENLLLSSSEAARIFSPASGDAGSLNIRGDAVRCSREWQADIGFQQQLSRYARFDAGFYLRRLKNPAEIVSFLQTNIAFPSTLDRSQSQGVEARLDIARVAGFSGFVSYTNLNVHGFAPITGGLFLGEAIELHDRAGERVSVEEDQRNTVVFEALYESLPGKLWVAFGGRFDSGYSIELEPDVEQDDFKDVPKKILDEVNFNRGFIKPHSVLNLSLGRDFKLTERLLLSTQVNIQNLADRFYLFSFDSVFTGTGIGRPRRYSGRLSLNFK